MSKRIYPARVIKWGIGVGAVGIPLAIILFMFLASIGAITILNDSGDLVCAGNNIERCRPWVEFRANEDIFLYKFDDLGQMFGVDKPDMVEEVKVYREWGSGYREINFTKGCTGSWCGCYWCRTNQQAEFVYVFRANQTYNITFDIKKKYPNETIKWSFTSQLDPLLIGTDYKREDVVKMIENTDGCLTDCHTIYQVCNPTAFDYLAKTKDDFDLVFNKRMGNLINYGYQILVNETYNVSLPIEKTNIVNGTEVVEIIGYVSRPRYRMVWQDWKPTNKNWKAGECKTIKVWGKKNPVLGVNNVDNTMSFAGYNFIEYAWWNSTAENCYNITITNPNTFNTKYNASPPVRVNLTDLIYQNVTKGVKILNEGCKITGATEITYNLLANGTTAGVTGDTPRKWAYVEFRMPNITANSDVNFSVWYNWSTEYGDTWSPSGITYNDWDNHINIETTHFNLTFINETSTGAGSLGLYAISATFKNSLTNATNKPFTATNLFKLFGAGLNTSPYVYQSINGSYIKQTKFYTEINWTLKFSKNLTGNITYTFYPDSYFFKIELFEMNTTQWSYWFQDMNTTGNHTYYHPSNTRDWKEIPNTNTFWNSSWGAMAFRQFSTSGGQDWEPTFMWLYETREANWTRYPQGAGGEGGFNARSLYRVFAGTKGSPTGESDAGGQGWLNQTFWFGYACYDNDDHRCNLSKLIVNESYKIFITNPVTTSLGDEILKVFTISDETLGPIPNEDEEVMMNVSLDAVGTIDTVWVNITRGTNQTNLTVTKHVSNVYYIIIASGNYTAHDLVKWTFEANDTGGSYAKGTEQSFTVKNQAPSLSARGTVNMTTNVYTNSELNCTHGSFVDNDEEDTRQAIYFEWWFGKMGQGWSNSSARNNSATFKLSQYGDKDWNVTCSVKVYDGYSNSSWQNSSNIANISDSRPTKPTLSVISPSTAYPISTLSVGASGSTDADGDTIHYYYKWNNSQGGTFQNWTQNSTLVCNGYAGCNQSTLVYAWATAVNDLNSTPSIGQYRNITQLLNVTAQLTNSTSFELNISTGNLTFNFTSQTVTWYNATPDNQTKSYGVYNISNFADRTLDVFISINMTHSCVYIILSNSSAYSSPLNVSTTSVNMWNNMLAGTSHMFWVWIDMINCTVPNLFVPILSFAGVE